MSEDELPTVTSPTLPTDDGIVHTQKQFSDNLTQDLTDEEIQQCMRLILPIKAKWQNKFRYKFNDPDTFNMDDVFRFLSEFEDEVKTTLAEKVNVLATVDTTPLLEGKAPVIEYIGVLPGHNLSKYGMDHEKKIFEVKKATERNEDFLGQRS